MPSINGNLYHHQKGLEPIKMQFKLQNRFNHPECAFWTNQKSMHVPNQTQSHLDFISHDENSTNWHLYHLLRALHKPPNRWTNTGKTVWYYIYIYSICVYVQHHPNTIVIVFALSFLQNQYTGNFDQPAQDRNKTPIKMRGQMQSTHLKVQVSVPYWSAL